MRGITVVVIARKTHAVRATDGTDQPVLACVTDRALPVITSVMEYYSSSGGFLHELRVLLPRYSSSRVALRPQKTTNERGRRSADCVLLFLPTSYLLSPLTPSNFSTSTSYIFSRPPLSLAFPSPTPTLPILSLSFSYSLPLVRY